MSRILVYGNKGDLFFKLEDELSNGLFFTSQYLYNLNPIQTITTKFYISQSIMNMYNLYEVKGVKYREIISIRKKINVMTFFKKPPLIRQQIIDTIHLINTSDDIYNFNDSILESKEGPIILNLLDLAIYGD